MDFTKTYFEIKNLDQLSTINHIITTNGLRWVNTIDPLGANHYLAILYPDKPIYVLIDECGVVEWHYNPTRYVEYKKRHLPLFLKPKPKFNGLQTQNI